MASTITYQQLDSFDIIKDASETIKMCTNILKINKKNKKQQRMFVLSNKAIYNIKTNKKTSVIQRRIDLTNIASITLSETSTEFTINIPSEYDYRYDAMTNSSKNEIISEICEATTSLQHSLFINKINDTTTTQWTITKNVLKKMDTHYDNTVRLVSAMDYLESMGFKRNMARKALNKNKGNISFAIQSLIQEHVKLSQKSQTKRSLFISATISPISISLNPMSDTPLIKSPVTPITPSQSVTGYVDDSFVM
eukprot:277029_1